MKYSYAYEKLYLAVRGLATGKGDARGRVADAFIYHLIHLKSEPLPKEMAKTLGSIEKRLTLKPPLMIAGEVYRGTIAQSTRSMRNQTAANIALQIFKMYEEVKRLYQEDVHNVKKPD